MTPELLDTPVVGAAEEAVELIGSVLDSSTEFAIIATDPEGVILLWNEGARRLYGYVPAEIVGQSWSVLHTDEDVRAGLPRDMIRTALREGKWEGTVQRVRNDGSNVTTRVVTTPRRGIDDKPGGFLLVSSDITEQARLDGELIKAQPYAQSLLESAPDAMVIVNNAGEVQLANAETEKLFGYTREELIGGTVEKLIPRRHHDRFLSHRGGFFSARWALPIGVGLELWGRRKNGVEFPIEISLSPLETEGGLLATAAIRDVTERRRFEHELRDANVQLEAADRAKDRFLAGMSHELRTPLNAILGFTGTLLMELPGPLNADQTRQMATVQANGKQLLSLINDLLDLARIESGKFEPSIERVECQDLLQEVAMGLRPLADEKGIDLEVAPVADRCEIRSDRRSLSQILINLTSNAIKFTDEGAVRLELSRHSDEGIAVVRFRVIDTGRGIRADDQERLFAAFEQVGGPTSIPYEGTGLGLYICQTLAKPIGGVIAFESEHGKGSAFTLAVQEQ